MYTILITADNKHVVVPNSTITAEMIVNYTADTARRVDLQYTIKASVEPEKVKAVMTHIAIDNNYVHSTKPVTVGIERVAGGAAVYNLWIWIDAPNYWNALYSLQQELVVAFRQNGIEMAEEIRVRNEN
jgi:small conductance mechanosensitive channel